MFEFRLEACQSCDHLVQAQPFVCCMTTYKLERGSQLHLGSVPCSVKSHDSVYIRQIHPVGALFLRQWSYALQGCNGHHETRHRCVYRAAMCVHYNLVLFPLPGHRSSSLRRTGARGLPAHGMYAAAPGMICHNE